MKSTGADVTIKRKSYWGKDAQIFFSLSGNEALSKPTYEFCERREIWRRWRPSWPWREMIWFCQRESFSWRSGSFSRRAVSFPSWWQCPWRWDSDASSQQKPYYTSSCFRMIIYISTKRDEWLGLLGGIVAAADVGSLLFSSGVCLCEKKMWVISMHTYKVTHIIIKSYRSMSRAFSSGPHPLLHFHTPPTSTSSTKEFSTPRIWLYYTFIMISTCPSSHLPISLNLNPTNFKG